MNMNFEQTQTNTCKEEATDWRSTSLDEFFEKGTVDDKCFVSWFGGRHVPEFADAENYHCFVINEDDGLECWLCIKKACVIGKQMTITVLDRYIGMVIGRGGENIKKIAKALGLNYIKVEKI